ncbi:ribonuclease kappa-B [Amyelois transitella]|uniref:ribonuclease kappa-B n=1 Tax=Amyelois transitella TaxID=680683 RepID=UPI00067AEDFB|nr:ribonuclease kappa-B [Amyelois transitella]
MGALYSGGMCCLCLSIWAVIQLTLMGFFYSIEASTLVDDVEAEKYNDISDYLSITKANFQKISGVCYYTAYIYVVMILVSWYMISRGKSNDRKAAEKAYAEESLCGTLDDPK